MERSPRTDLSVLAGEGNEQWMDRAGGCFHGGDTGVGRWISENEGRAATGRADARAEAAAEKTWSCELRMPTGVCGG